VLLSPVAFVSSKRCEPGLSISDLTRRIPKSGIFESSKHTGGNCFKAFLFSSYFTGLYIRYVANWK
jgi:hypothetical protein